MRSRLKVALLAAGILLGAGAAVWGQGATGVNPAPGSVWTYLGPTFGAGWSTPPGIGNTAQPAHYFYAGPLSGANAIPQFRLMGAGDIPSGMTIDSPIFTGIPVAPTATPGTNTTQLATTEFVTNSNALPWLKDMTPGPPWTTNSYGSWNAARFSVNSYPVSGERSVPWNPNYSTATTLMAGINVPSNATVVDPVNESSAGIGIGGYALSASPVFGAAGLYGFGGSTANNIESWGLNTVTTNCPKPNCSTNTGFAAKALWGIEIDINLMKVGGAAPAGTIVKGIDIVGASETQVGGGGASIGVFVQPLGIGTPKIPWQLGFGTGDQAANQGIALGSIGASGSVTGGQPICWSAYNGTPTNNVGCASTDMNGSIQLDSWTGQVHFQTNHADRAIVTPTAFVLQPQGTAPGSNSLQLDMNSVDTGGATRTGFIQGITNGTAQDIHIAAVGGSVVLEASGVPAIKTTSNPAAQSTGMFLLVNNNTGLNLTAVSLGPVDGCGSGFRCLRVPN